MFKICLSVKEVLCELNIGRTKLYSEISAGKLSARKIGRKTVFLGEEVTRYAEALPILK